MVEKFNFYDIYGYLIPGLALTGLLWLPFGVLWHAWPKAEFSSAILVLLFAYVLGHVIQSLRIPTSEMQDKNGCWRHPSNVLLDDDDFSLAHETKKKIHELATQHFKIDVKKKDDPKDKQKQIDGRREAVFFQARSALLKGGGEKTYWEQFEGLYAMMRNLTLASAAGAFYFLGWSARYTPVSDDPTAPRWLLGALIAAVIFSVARPLRKSTKAQPGPTVTEQALEAAQKKPAVEDEHCCPEKSSEEIWNRWLARGLATSLALTAFFGGMLTATATTAAARQPEPKKECAVCCTSVTPCPPQTSQEEPQVAITVSHPGWLMFVLALGAAVVSGRTYRAYKEFAKQFALAVWRDFANFEVAPPQPIAPGQAAR